MKVQITQFVEREIVEQLYIKFKQMIYNNELKCTKGGFREYLRMQIEMFGSDIESQLGQEREPFSDEDKLQLMNWSMI